MSLSWQPACDAEYYLVSLWDEDGNAILDNKKTSTNTINPGSLDYGKKYTWRVNTVPTLSSKTVTGDIWSFSTPKREIKEGRTELEHLCRSGIAYIQPMTAKIWFAASNDSITLGDRGPGAMSGVFTGQPGTYSLSVSFLDGGKGKDWYGVSINNVLVDSWNSTSSSGLAVHKLPSNVHLAKNDQVRVDFYTSSGCRARMDCIDLTLVEADGIEAVTNDTPSESVYYDLFGRKVLSPQPGRIYIRNGRKVRYID